ncbi:MULTISPECIES: hypothetical protein [Ralstonia solanacearum species complex]|uniref:hypothetical protein n=1 Tax=Ralstonia solanacearum species complex TaxID=3116862 RepID=UPI000E58E053|nr:hypothetical protein [Ralstonia solanacearum]BEU75111.1 hypothetical protein MAFF211271_46660 [Ralstonia pseudosolanacearum]AXV79879.1 hypothetical protein CJO76_23805 [Ralstonia solanacearum]AXV93912.1 hypothetical protein CJO79_23790 [Ralstonia solanacearum]AXW21895.1 hypothetical protein CJO85_23920 [Ralstonia solanacearum]AXW64626.1 hypothetical protein CJO94_23920 [Ralstonia solanacearum]
MKRESNAEACEGHGYRTMNRNSGDKRTSPHGGGAFHSTGTSSFAFAGRKQEHMASGSSRGHLAQNYAFGILFVLLSGIMAVAMLVKKHPEATERAIGSAVALLGDWRTWAVTTAGVALTAVVCVLLQPRR